MDDVTGSKPLTICEAIKSPFQKTAKNAPWNYLPAELACKIALYCGCVSPIGEAFKRTNQAPGGHGPLANALWAGVSLMSLQPDRPCFRPCPACRKRLGAELSPLSYVQVWRKRRVEYIISAGGEIRRQPYKHEYMSRCVACSSRGKKRARA